MTACLLLATEICNGLSYVVANLAWHRIVAVWSSGMILASGHSQSMREVPCSIHGSAPCYLLLLPFLGACIDFLPGLSISFAVQHSHQHFFVLSRTAMLSTAVQYIWSMYHEHAGGGC